MRRIALLLIICIDISMFSSCYDAKEIDDLLHVVAIGVDRGIKDKWRLTILSPSLKGGAGESSQGGMQTGGGQQSEYFFITVDAPSFFSGIDIINSTLSRRLNFMHTELLVVSEDIARSGMMGEFLAPIVRFRQIRRSLHVLVTKGTALDYIDSTKPSVGTALSKNIQIMSQESGITGFFPHVTLQNLYDQMKSNYRQPVVTLAALGNPENLNEEEENSGNTFKTGGDYYAGDLPLSHKQRTEVFGAAVFDGDRMVGRLTGDETRLMMMASGEFKMAFYTMQDPKKPSLIVPLDVRRLGKPKVIIKLDGDKPIIHLKVELEGDLLAIQSNIDYERPELKPLLEKAFEKQIKEGLDKLMEKSIDLKSDIFGFGQTAARKFLTIQEWEKYNWVSKFQNAEITTEVKFTIRRTGTQLESSPIISTEGEIR